MKSQHNSNPNVSECPVSGKKNIRGLEEEGQDDVAPGVMTNTGEPTTEAERAARLDDFVSKMDSSRNTSGVEGFKRTRRAKTEEMYSVMLETTKHIELNILIGENEVFEKSEAAFFSNADEVELQELRSQQAIELKNLKIRQDQTVRTNLLSHPSSKI